eukprot:921594-Prorocentrum_minimum.AAC.1
MPITPIAGAPTPRARSPRVRRCCNPSFVRIQGPTSNWMPSGPHGRGGVWACGQGRIVLPGYRTGNRRGRSYTLLKASFAPPRVP